MSSIERHHVRVSTEPMTLDQVLEVADGSAVTLTEDAAAVIRRSRSVVDAAIHRGEAIYGVTTGVGHARDDRLPTPVLEAMQSVLIETHVGAMGDPLPTTLVRAAMVVRLNGFARGGAGVSLEVARTLEAMLNEHIHPIIPRTGSVGSGDLGQLAFLGRAMLGRGEVEWRGSRVDAREALDACGIPMMSLRPKDGLGIISANAVTVGHGIVSWRTVDDLLSLADVVAATSMEAIRANPSFFDPVVAAARGIAGQVTTSSNLRGALSGSSRVSSPTAVSVQDPLSFRVVPQVHGACRDVSATMASRLADELNAASDNPLVDVETDRILSNGNFQIMDLALAVESLNLALSHVGLLCERRTGHLWDLTVSSLGADMDPEATEIPLGDGAPPLFAGLALRYPAAARYTRLRQLAHPITLDVPPLDLSVEDHATNAAETVWVTDQIVDTLIDLLVVEALIAVARLSIIEPGAEGLGTGTTKLVDLIIGEVGALGTGTRPEETHERVAAAMREHLDVLVGREG